MDGEFKVPQNIAQDLLLIQGFIGVPNPAPNPASKSQEDDIDSSDSETISEDEVAADLIAADEDDSTKTTAKILEPSDSSSETNSSLSDGDTESEPEDDSRNNNLQDQDDDEDLVPNATSGTYFQTKHEIAETDIVIPEVDRIDPDEVLEKVGEVMNIVDRVVIIKGHPSNMLNRGSDRALDSDTLLVFDDRTVMGYVYETFGPTAQPLYQVKFNSAFPLDLERVKIGREVFHVPAKSRFVFVNQIKALKGSDASNVHDEEPADDELEFSDDEAEAAYRSQLKRKRAESRSRSVVSSRQSTPNPSQMRDQELVDEMYLSRNAYDAHGPYDMDFDSSAAAGPSRPPPIPYDDPYGDDYTAPVAEPSNMGSASSLDSKPSQGSGSDRGNDRGERQGRGRGRGRNRGKDRGVPRDRGRGGRGGGSHQSSQQHNDRMDTPTEFDGHSTRSLSPTSLAIARATGQAPTYGSQYQQHQQQSFSPMYPDAHGNGSSWGYNHVQAQAQFQQHQYGYMQQPYQPQHAHMLAPLVQPHINPRFASAFGIAINTVQQPNQIPFTPQNTTTHPNVGATGSPNLVLGNNAPGPRSSFHWSDEWKADRGSSTS